MILRDITLNDKNLFNDFDYICSDYLFSYLFMYCETYKLKIAEDEQSIIIFSEYNKPTFYMPLGDIKSGIIKVIDYCRRNNINPVFCKIPESYVVYFKELNFKIKEDRNSFDYIFSNDELASYEGKKFRKQRNNLASFLKVCTPQYDTDIYNHIEECKEFTKTHYSDPDILIPTMRILDNLGSFHMSGGIVKSENEVQAFCIYEKVSDDTVLSHVELTNNEYRGVHPYMIKEMSGRIDEKYINKEDDMGLPGLRRFKLSYNPCMMIKKYTAYLI